MNWLISANSSKYNHSSSFENFSYIDWRQGKVKFKNYDIVYIYCTKPIQSIKYKCIIEKTNLTHEEIRDDEEYWLDKSEYKKALSGKFMRLKLVALSDSIKLDLPNLLSNNLKAAPQGPIKLEGNLLKYIESNFDNNNIHPDIINESEDIFEGIKETVNINRYERNRIARSKCIEFHGTNCKVCNLDFEKKYGSIGKGFIHVHHIIPLHKIEKEYRINPIEDLIPVCPNCHAMLHRKINNIEPTIEELKLIIKDSNSNQ